MEAELYRQVYKVVLQLANLKSPKNCQYRDHHIVLTYLWAVLHDRPIYWACKKCNWPSYYRNRPLPSCATMSRRLRSESFCKLLSDIEKHLIEQNDRSLCRWIDAKGLRVGYSSKDPQAKLGHADGGPAKGYKLYAVADRSQGFVAWTVKPMNESECIVAQQLICNLDSQGYLIGDRAYDTNRLYELSATKSIQLIAPQRYPNAKGLGHRRHSIYRLRSLALGTTTFGQSLLNSRIGIEAMFGQLTNLGCGLSPLPNWVRTQFRVELWVRGKMIIYHLWRRRNKPHAA